MYDYEAIRSNIREQAARCMDCGVPFCQVRNIVELLLQFTMLVESSKFRDEFVKSIPFSLLPIS